MKQRRNGCYVEEPSKNVHFWTGSGILAQILFSDRSNVCYYQKCILLQYCGLIYYFPLKETKLPREMDDSTSGAGNM
jgi:hypothetical protein